MEKILETLVIENAVTIAHLNTIEEAFLGLCKELLPSEQWKSLAVNFYEILYQKIEKYLADLPDVSQAAVLRANYSAFEYRNQMLSNLDG